MKKSLFNLIYVMFSKHLNKEIHSISFMDNETTIDTLIDKVESMIKTDPEIPRDTLYSKFIEYINDNYELESLGNKSIALTKK